MLIEFRFKNFRSFRDECIFSLVASSDKARLTDNTIEIENSQAPKLIKVAGIYGANASGKSNLIKAMLLMQSIVANSAIVQPNQPLPTQSFQLDSKSLQEPTEFEITFLHEQVRYQFGFAFTPERVIKEWLVAYQTSRGQLWYSREFDDKQQTFEYKLGSHLTGAKAVWRNATRPNSLFLSTAVQLNSEQLKPVFDWITKNLIIFNNHFNPDVASTIEHIKQNGSDQVRKFLLAADIAIDNIELKSYPGVQFQFDSATGQLSKIDEEQTLPVFLHSTKTGSAKFEYRDESDGTQRWFSLAGPLFEILQRKHVLLVDELDKSLHTLLVRHFIEMFQVPPKGKDVHSQLIFTTHDTSLLSADLLRRDQIWFVEKDENQASRLFPLTDFAPRTNEAFERRYLSGRYGALPFLGQRIK